MDSAIGPDRTVTTVHDTATGRVLEVHADDGVTWRSTQLVPFWRRESAREQRAFNRLDKGARRRARNRRKAGKRF